MSLRHLTTLIAGVLLASCATAPVQEMSDARQAIAAAEAAGAAERAPLTYAEAQRFIAEAEQQIRDEAYGPARANAVRAKTRALQALEEAQELADEE